MPGLRLICLGLTEAWKTQAVYHAVAELMTEESPDTIILCRPAAPYLCLGYHQLFEGVFDASACDRMSLPVYRRKIGGGGTLLDSGQLFYQCVFHRSRVPARTDRLFAMMLDPPVALLRQLGLDAHLHDVNEISVGRRRIAGTGGGALGDAVVVVGNILGSFPFEWLPVLWRGTDDPGFREIAGVALRAHLTTLEEQSLQFTFEELESLLIEHYRESLSAPLVAEDLTPAEWEAACNAREELTSDEFLHSLPCEYANASSDRPLKIASGVFLHTETAHTRGGVIHATLLVEEGIITASSLRLEGSADSRIVERKLHGLRVERWREAVDTALEAA
jgi:lipoate-protein ligase A